MNWFVVIGVLALAAGTVQLFFRRPLTRTSESAARSLNLPSVFVARTWPAFVLVRCVPLWLVGIGLILVGVLAR